LVCPIEPENTTLGCLIVQYPTPISRAQSGVYIVSDWEICKLYNGLCGLFLYSFISLIQHYPGILNSNQPFFVFNI